MLKTLNSSNFLSILQLSVWVGVALVIGNIFRRRHWVKTWRDLWQALCHRQIPFHATLRWVLLLSLTGTGCRIGVIDSKCLFATWTKIRIQQNNAFYFRAQGYRNGSSACWGRSGRLKGGGRNMSWGISVTEINLYSFFNFSILISRLARCTNMYQ